MQQTILHLKNGDSLPCLPPDPVLQELVNAVRDPAGKSFNLGQQNGTALTVPAQDIVGVELSPPFCVVKNFLSPAELEQTIAHCVAHEQQFEDATVSLPEIQNNSQPDYRLRKSMVLNQVEELMPFLAPKLNAMMPKVWPHLRMPPMGFGKIECQMAAHGEGGYFRTHTDNGLPDIAHRRVSYVYYFHREPQQFQGGVLRFYGTRVQADGIYCGQAWAEVPPPRNGVVVFPSTVFHEVTEVTCASTALMDQRLSINGWLCV